MLIQSGQKNIGDKYKRKYKEICLYELYLSTFITILELSNV